jgi:hypothetical protein
MTRDENNKANASKKSKDSEKRSLKEDVIDNNECERYGRNLSHSERSISNRMVGQTMTFFGYIDLKKKRVGYPSVMKFETYCSST